MFLLLYLRNLEEVFPTLKHANPILVSSQNNFGVILSVVLRLINIQLYLFRFS